jgi:hypothetical protein
MHGHSLVVNGHEINVYLDRPLGSQCYESVISCIRGPKRKFEELGSFEYELNLEK